MTQDINVLALVKGSERYVFLYDDASRAETLRVLGRYATKAMELAPRDIVARAIQTELDEGRGIDGQSHVHLDLRHLGAERIKERLPGIREIAMDFAGVDPIEAPIPVQPGQHYSMGGVASGVNGVLYRGIATAPALIHAQSRGSEILRGFAQGQCQHQPQP